MDVYPLHWIPSKLGNCDRATEARRRKLAHPTNVQDMAASVKPDLGHVDTLDTHWGNRECRTVRGCPVNPYQMLHI